ncbi:MAG: zinc ribbon domain-containing protein [Patulibacter sp.]
MDTSDETRTTPVRACPGCGARVQPRQRRCTNCGGSVEQRRRLARRTPLVAALLVAALGGGAVVVAQAAVTERAAADASASADTASAPVEVAGNPLPAADLPTSASPTPEPAPPDRDNADDASDVLNLPDLPSLDDATTDSDTTDDSSSSTSQDGENTDDDTGADSDDLGTATKLKVKHTENYDPNQRVGVEFGKPKAAVDKRTRTVWDVNIPADGQPFGVGIVLDLKSTKRVSSLRIQTPTPGFGAEIYRADATEIPETLADDTWVKAATVTSVSDDVVVPLSDEPEWARYVLLWLTTPPTTDATRVAISNLQVLP